MTAIRRILIVGGYGTFGGRLVDLLQDEARLTLVVAGRSRDKAAAFCAARAAAKAGLVPTAFDRRADLGPQLASLAPDLCVDASGPFQDYGADGYRLIEACIAVGIHYLDLADGSDFVAGVSAFDAAAKAAGVFALSGVSSCPVLTAAVTRQLAIGLVRVTSIQGGIAPSPFARVGENVVRAISAYAGQPVALRRGGRDVTAYPFTETLRFTIAPPGLMPLRRRLFSLVDVPDLRVLADLWPEATDIWIGAGPVPEPWHRALIALAWLVRWRLLSSVAPLAPLMHRVTNRLRWGEHRGGMFVAIEGRTDSGESVRRSWHLLAVGDDGPLIPCMAVEAIVRKALSGVQPLPGARAAVRELELRDYEALFARRAIRAGTRDSVPDRSTSLCHRILGSAWDDLPEQIRAMHGAGRDRIASGRCSVQRGSSLMARCIASLFHFPDAADDLPVTVRFEARDDRETWTRTFGEKTMTSDFRPGYGADEGLLCECFGPFAFAQALVADHQGLQLILRRWTAFGVPMPSWLGPRSNSHMTIRDGRYRFFVEISHPLAGPMVRYQGWLAPAACSLSRRSPDSPSRR